MKIFANENLVIKQVKKLFLNATPRMAFSCTQCVFLAEGRFLRMRKGLDCKTVE